MPKKKGGAPLEFDIIGPEGAALQFDGKYGRSVRFKDGTEYVIEVTNKIYAHYAVAIKIDGQKVTTTPMVIFPKGGRKVAGFTDKKTFSRETNEDVLACAQLKSTAYAIDATLFVHTGHRGSLPD